MHHNLPVRLWLHCHQQGATKALAPPFAKLRHELLHPRESGIRRESISTIKGCFICPTMLHHRATNQHALRVKLALRLANEYWWRFAERADLYLTHSLHHQLSEGFHMRWLEAAFALHVEDFLVTEEVGGIAHDEGGFTRERTGQFHG